MSAGTLIVGASQAGLQLAVSLREEGSRAPITLVGAEPHLPYQRPPLSKSLLSGGGDRRTLTLRAGDFYEQQAIEVICGERVTHLRLTPDGRGTATTDRGRGIEFDRLALTVGARPRRLAVPGADLDGVHCLRDVEDAERLRDEVSRAAHVVVVGGGFIGLEVASAARSCGAAVTVVEAADRLLSRSVHPLVSDFYRKAHENRGVTVHLDAAVVGVTGARGRATGVELADGLHIPADVVVVGVGVLPRTELAEQLGLLCDGGIVVDEFARTSNPAVVAAGDCTVLPDPLARAGRIRLESVQNAVSQAKVAAATLAGRLAPYTAVPWFWSDQYDLKLQMAGSTVKPDAVVVRGEPEGERFSVLHYRDGELTAVTAVNAIADYLTVRKALTDGATIPAERARQADVPLKDLVLPRHRSDQGTIRAGA